MTPREAFLIAHVRETSKHPYFVIDLVEVQCDPCPKKRSCGHHQIPLFSGKGANRREALWSLKKEMEVRGIQSHIVKEVVG